MPVKTPPPESAATLTLLETILRKLSIPIRREPLGVEGLSTTSHGGLCRIRGRKVILIDPSAPDDQAIALILDALKTIDLSDIYLPPSIRALLEERESSRNPE